MSGVMSQSFVTVQSRVRYQDVLSMAQGFIPPPPEAGDSGGNSAKIPQLRAAGAESPPQPERVWGGGNFLPGIRLLYRF